MNTDNIVFLCLPHRCLSFGKVTPGPLILVSAGPPQTDIVLGEGWIQNTTQQSHASQEQLPPNAAAAVKTDCPARRDGEEERPGSNLFLVGGFFIFFARFVHVLVHPSENPRVGSVILLGFNSDFNSILI